MTPCPHTTDARNCWHCRPRPLAFDAGPLADSLPAADRVPNGYSPHTRSDAVNADKAVYPLYPVPCPQCGGHMYTSVPFCKGCGRAVCTPCWEANHRNAGILHRDPVMESNEGRT